MKNLLVDNWVTPLMISWFDVEAFNLVTNNFLPLPFIKDLTSFL